MLINHLLFQNEDNKYGSSMHYPIVKHPSTTTNAMIRLILMLRHCNDLYSTLYAHRLLSKIAVISQCTRSTTYITIAIGTNTACCTEVHGIPRRSEQNNRCSTTRHSTCMCWGHYNTHRLRGISFGTLRMNVKVGRGKKNTKEKQTNV
jgi:hypothetical protein